MNLPIERGDRGDDVRAVQKKVGVARDGVFGEDTERAVRAWQRKHMLAADGIVGPITYRKMFPLRSRFGQKARTKLTAYPIVQVRHNRKHGGERSLRDIKGIVIHYTYGNNPGDKDILLEGNGREVSVHYLICDDDDPSATETDKTSIYQALALTTIGWSVGMAREGWGNASTVSIELSNLGNEPPTETQLRKLDYLISAIDLKLGRRVPIRGHCEIALPAGRKAGDPNSTFPLAAYKKNRRH